MSGEAFQLPVLRTEFLIVIKGRNMNDYQEYYKARKKVEEILRKDFIGPVIDDEVIAETPLQYYIMGKLYPQSAENEILDLARNPFLESENDAYDTGLSLSNVSNPSSSGITFTVKPGTVSIAVNVQYSWYRPVEFSQALENSINTEKWDNLKDNQKPGLLWKRQPVEYASVINPEKIVKSQTIELEHGIQLFIYKNKIYNTGETVLTVSLINRNKVDKDLKETAKKTIFQVAMSITSEQNESVFTSVGRQIDIGIDPEIQELDLLYRDNHYYAQGHGCSVKWDLKNPEPLWIASDYFPSYNLLQMKAATFDDMPVFGMKFLAEGEGQEIIDLLKSFMKRYRTWISDTGNKTTEFNEREKTSANRNIQKCQAALEQIEQTVLELEKSLTSDKLVWRAFQMANEAMYMQRVQTMKKNNWEIEPEKILWYPFQLAFILHEIISFINPESEARSKVDLLWFPTGGGKTEAYLGISAFAIFLRRLRNCQNDGVTVIMRYTLRLLTLQQFERASILIFACELLRIKYNLGGKEISIGLWVGDKLTPNKLADAKKNLRKNLKGDFGDDEEGNPCQVKICPWCGKSIVPADYEVDTESWRMKIRCSNNDCEFSKLSDGMPLHLIDESIYRHVPTFIVATIDKFAQLPLKSEPSALFGLNGSRNPPELIIQDELHLISGPLGTMTGIYEAAITKLCEKNGIPVKILASTATIRNAENQIKALYGRELTQFPPQGITISDSFFAEISEVNEKPAREYLGIMGIGTTATTTLIRVEAALLFATRYLEVLNFEDTVIDNYWSITGYFNSLRELGSATTQITDDVQSRYQYLCKAKFHHVYPGINVKARHDNIVELTSRMNNSEITRVIQIGMKRGYTKKNPVDPYSFILASNMISVGVDVGRLGSMIVVGQPKTNSEYIQATSRVGRENPGLVLTVYNPSRSRDRSHYEQFLRYHSGMYRYVEATSLTPFSDRARDRGLHTLFVILCRYLIEDLKGNSEAINFNADSVEVQQIKKIILEYVAIVDRNELEDVERELDEIMELWEDRAVGELDYYNYSKDGEKKKLLRQDIVEDRFRTMNSMRSVEAQSGIYLLGR